MSDPTTRAAWLVQGEVELGPQRRCRDCWEWWPLVAEHWDYRVKGERRCYLQPCRACRQPARREYLRRWRARRAA